ncbi:hypothetical protein HDU98_001341 [Podochytrium sp. JEL0797]|nr:hypothetical protein HDU98_001341 [Podochytrium sp. JEL0797]
MRVSSLALLVAATLSSRSANAKKCPRRTKKTTASTVATSQASVVATIPTVEPAPAPQSDSDPALQPTSDTTTTTTSTTTTTTTATTTTSSVEPTTTAPAPAPAPQSEIETATAETASTMEVPELFNMNLGDMASDAMITTTDAPAQPDANIPETTDAAAPAPAPQPDVQTTEEVAPLPAPQPDVQTTEAVTPLPAPQPDVQTEPAPAPQPEIQTTDAPAPLPAPQPDPQTTDAPAPPPVQPTPPSPPPITQGTCSSANLAACKPLTATDTPPSIAGMSFSQGCTILANYARAHYNPGSLPLMWDAKLATAALASATYSATNNCWDCHTNSGAGTTWGQNLYLGKTGCAESYNGWVTNEAAGLDPVNIDAGHFQNVVGFAVPYVSIGCGVSLVGQGATVCNYGMVFSALAIKFGSFGYINRHLSDSNFHLISDCIYTFPVTDPTATCASVASTNSMSQAALQQMNPWSRNVMDSAQGNSTAVGSPATSIPAKNAPVGNSTVSAVTVSGSVQTAMLSATSATTAPTTTATTVPQQTTEAAPETTEAAPQTTAEAPPPEVQATEAAPAPPPPPPPVVQAPTPPPAVQASSFSSPCSIYDGSCAARAAFDSPPNVAGTGIAYECLTLTNYARNLYVPRYANLVWSNILAGCAQATAEYATVYNCADWHTNSEVPGARTCSSAKRVARTRISGGSRTKLLGKTLRILMKGIFRTWLGLPRRM